MEGSRLCPKFEKAFQLLGKRWIGVIIRVLEKQPMRFNEIAEQIPHISQKMLSDRLKELEMEQIVIRDVYPETPVRIEYRLSEKGHAITPVLEEVQHWADKWVTMDDCCNE
ncbi:helix-turn-helix transcriptional regulator [Heyndrickxia oleronia]|jgi:DNA-binding HxlR family transcriptional regulator|uniref:winged helix-turn-helix transcriptional regulator n=1 Tax=Heyndrickxia TaxID=2837504 RepID=UPI0003A7E479|nr:helix-turn-helix domain-containing protein [Heyndrickxia oleronia]NYV68976.1 helix-turn-helix transcriptional regulator [Bacillus sp. Gen3]OJH16710.1 transcriptional regulator [Bacillus obstructivus]MBU5212269.1 helix-turn-helix transcriptional regulator [Heyndrickxia oleronia]MCM3454645.1 helix-turn-helix transcriptional regulator [Heyndrickxia oleronia]GIN41674.1 transcriptional regulator [Heyndrickxia oleronia]